jgi:hypothetical protein
MKITLYIFCNLMRKGNDIRELRDFKDLKELAEFKVAEEPKIRKKSKWGDPAIPP